MSSEKEANMTTQMDVDDSEHKIEQPVIEEQVDFEKDKKRVLQATDIAEDDLRAKKKAKLLEKKAELEVYLIKLQAALKVERQRSISGTASGMVNLGNGTKIMKPKPTRRKSVSRSRKRSSIDDDNALYSPPKSSYSRTVHKTKSGRAVKKPTSIYQDNTPLAYSFRQCERILDDLLKHQYAYVFSTPVDWKALKLLDYPKIVKSPMDLGTIQKKLSTGQYETVEQFQKDVQLVWDNAKLFNPANNHVHMLAVEFEGIFSKKFSAFLRDKRKTRNPVSAAAELPAAKPASKPRKRKPASKQTPLSDMEKEKLRAGLVKIPENKIQGIIRIINKSKKFKHDGKEEVEVDIDKLDTATLRKLQQFVKNASRTKNSKAKTPAYSKVAPAVAVETYPADYDPKGLSSDSDSSSFSDTDSSSEEELKDEANVTSAKVASPLDDAKSPSPITPIETPKVDAQEVHIENTDAWSNLQNGQESENATDGSTSELWKDFQQKDAEKKQRIKELREQEEREEKRKRDHQRVEEQRRALENQRKIEEMDRERQRQIELLDKKATVDEADDTAEFESLVGQLS